MSDTEKEAFKKEIIKDFIKEWRPLVGAVFAMILFAISSTWWIAHNIATTADVQKVSKGIDTLTKSFNVLNTSFNNHVETGNTTKIIFKGRIDSLARITTNIQKKRRQIFVTESYPNGRNRNPTLNNVN